MLVSASIQQSEIGGESEQEAQLLDPQVCAAQLLRTFPGVGGLYQRFQHVEGNALDPVPYGELMASGKSLDCHHKPGEIRGKTGGDRRRLSRISLTLIRATDYGLRAPLP